MRYLFAILLLLAAGPGSAQKERILKPVLIGRPVHIFNPNDTRSQEDTTWYTNDHCFIQDDKGGWHAYGIIGHHPVDPWNQENKFFHITADDIDQKKWVDHDYALRAKEGVEKVLWAPHVVKEGATYYMFYNIANLQPNVADYASWGGLCVATSKDLFHWVRHERNPLFSDAGHARDSYLKKIGNQWYYYYCRTQSEIDLRSAVAVRTGRDLMHWSGAQVAHTQPLANNGGGDAESPTVIEKDGIYYLFICLAASQYNLTHVYWSRDPELFPIANLVTTLPLHAAEVIHDPKKGWYVSNTGWDKRGLFLSKMKWEPVL